MQAEMSRAPETKAAETGEVAGAFDEFMRTFEAFKAENDGRLAEIERKRAADVLVSDKVDRINRALDEQKRLVDALVLSTRRPPRERGRKSRHTLHLCAQRLPQRWSRFGGTAWP